MRVLLYLRVVARKMPNQAVLVPLPDTEGELHVLDADNYVVVHDEHALGTEAGDGVETVVKGVHFLPEVGKKISGSPPFCGAVCGTRLGAKRPKKTRGGSQT